MNQSAKITSPHIHQRGGTGRIMLCVLLALLPAAAAGCISFGFPALTLLGVTVGTAVISELLFQLIFRQPVTVGDLSAAVTGLLLGMSLPPGFPLQYAAAGSAFAILIVKQLFGGIGKNFANPALTARMLLMLLFMQEMHKWTAPSLVPFGQTDAVSGATPLVSGASYWDMFLGNIPGCIGETCSVGLLLGGLFLWITGISSPAAPLAFFGSFALLSWIGGYDVLAQLLSGSLILCAVFMAADYTTTPLTRRGKVIFGICCGCLTYFIRHYGGYAEGAGFAVLLMNLFTPLIDRITETKPFGAVKYKKSRPEPVPKAE